MPNKLKEDPLVWAGIVCYAGEKEHLLHFSFMFQIVQFDIIKFRRTIKDYLYQFMWIENKPGTV